MKKRNLTPRNEKIKREQDPIPWRYCFLTLVCGLLLVVGFFWAARQHFSAMDLGIKNFKLRQQKESLESEQRLLERNKEVSLSPGEIKKVAKKMGLQDLTAQSIEIVSAFGNPIKEQNPSPQKTLVAKTVKTEKAEEQKKAEVSKSQISAASDLRDRLVKKN
jgi:hypothetical protein